MKRSNNFEQRHKHLVNLTEEQLKERFWMLAEKIVDPMFKLAKTHTTPAIERSVLLRMGFSSLDAKSIVNNAITYNLMGKGCGNIVWKLAEKLKRDYREVGRELAAGQHWSLAVKIFPGEK